MGYRLYISKLPKAIHNEIKDLSLDELHKRYENSDTNEPYTSHLDILNQETIYGFGKYVDFTFPLNTYPIFTRKEVNDYFHEDHDFWIVDKEFLKNVIGHYREKVKTKYNEMLNPFFGDRFEPSKFLNSVDETDWGNKTLDFSLITQEETNQLLRILEYVRGNRLEWNEFQPYDLDEGDEITNSWKFEYNIFELVRIYKTFDWENDLLIYHGY